MKKTIHPSALVEDGARLGAGVEIGPFCHVGPHPLNPPADPENPKWENLSSNVGAQYFWIDRIFSWQSDS